MSQHDFEILTADANTGVTFRAAVNAALQALASCSSGATEPTTTYAYQLWADTSAGYLKQRNSTNTAWIDLLMLGYLHAPLIDPSYTPPVDNSGASLVMTGSTAVTLQNGYAVLFSGEVIYPATADASAASIKIPCTFSGVLGKIKPMLIVGVGYKQMLITVSGTDIVLIPSKDDSTPYTNAELSGKTLQF